MRTLKLTNSNYYSQEANKAYISVSQYKDFFGSLGQSGCEYQAMAIINGEYKKEPTTAMRVLSKPLKNQNPNYSKETEV